MNLPSLALVTSMCKGLTLYTHLHLRKDKFSMNKTVIIAQQISQVKSTKFDCLSLIITFDVYYRAWVIYTQGE